MLDFAIKYCDALDTITGDRDMNLRQYELSKKDWNVAIQLQDVLKVRFIVIFMSIVLNLAADLQRRNSFLLPAQSKYCCCNTGNGSY